MQTDGAFVAPKPTKQKGGNYVQKTVLSTLIMLVILVFTVGGSVQAGEIIFADDIKQNVITKEVLVRAADNVIVLVDSSSSMGESDKNRTKPNYQLETEALKVGFQ